LGTEAEAAIASVSAQLGATTFDTGWIDAAATTCPGTEFREVTWDGLALRFGDAADATAPKGGRHFFGYSYPGGSLELTTAEGIGLRTSVAELEAAYGEALSTDNSPAEGPTLQVEGDLFFGGLLTGITAEDTVTFIEGGIRCAERGDRTPPA
jgi:hypothetical protein